MTRAAPASSSRIKRQKMIGGQAGPKGAPRHGLGAQGLPAGERATELSYAARVSIAGRAWLERGHPSQVLGCNNHTLIY